MRGRLPFCLGKAFSGSFSYTKVRLGSGPEEEVELVASRGKGISALGTEGL